MKSRPEGRPRTSAFNRARSSATGATDCAPSTDSAAPVAVTADVAVVADVAMPDIARVPAAPAAVELVVTRSIAAATPSVPTAAVESPRSPTPDKLRRSSRYSLIVFLAPRMDETEPPSIDVTPMPAAATPTASSPPGTFSTTPRNFVAADEAPAQTFSTEAPNLVWASSISALRTFSRPANPSRSRSNWPVASAVCSRISW